jgi:hypothetical protein
MPSAQLSLLYVPSRPYGAPRKVSEDINLETDLLSLAKDKVETSREVLEEINKKYRKLEKEKKNPAATPEQPDQPA